MTVLGDYQFSRYIKQLSTLLWEFANELVRYYCVLLIDQRFLDEFYYSSVKFENK